MKHLEPFDFEPTFQPDPDDRVSFKLKPLDLRGQQEILFSRNEDGLLTWAGIKAGSRYIIGWTGGKLGQFSPARVRQIVDGGPNPHWVLWLPEIAAKLYASIELSEATEKKS